MSRAQSNSRVSAERRDEHGVTFVPPRHVNNQHVALAALALAAVGRFDLSTAQVM